MLYRERNPKFIEAKQFLELDEEMLYLGLTEIPAEYSQRICLTCGKAMSGHSVFNGTVICPGTYLLMANGQITNFMTQANFEQLYVPLGITYIQENENDKDN